MKANFLAWGGTMLLTAAALSLGVWTAKGQEPSSSQPTAPGGHPDLTGSWVDPAARAIDPGFVPSAGLKAPTGPPAAGGLAGKDPVYTFNHIDDAPVNRRHTDPNQPPYKSELIAKVKDLDQNENRMDPAFFCKPWGVPRVGPPNKIAQYQGGVIFLYANEKGNAYRDIPTDGRAHDPLDTDTYFGDSVGHWEGNTLVVDAVGFTDDSWLGFDGWFHSDAMHVVERFSRAGDTLNYQATVEDPNVFTRPWPMNPHTLKLGQSVIIENPPCIEKDSSHIVSHEHH